MRSDGGDTFVKLKDGLARTLYESLSEERCSIGTRCRRRGDHLICSTENVRDPYVCELHLVDGSWVAPREDWALYHSVETNRRYGGATLTDGRLVIDGDAGLALAEELGVDAPAALVIDVSSGAVTPPD